MVQALLVPFGGAARWHGKFYLAPCGGPAISQIDITSPRHGSAPCGIPTHGAEVDWTAVLPLTHSAAPARLSVLTTYGGL